ncbi:MAG: hypothetical protein WAU89_10940 [Candidatus Acidiferrales bacterium]
MKLPSVFPSEITKSKIAQPQFANQKLPRPKITRSRIAKVSAAAVACIGLLGIFAVSLHAQAALLQQRVAELKEATAKNKLALAQYTWVEKVTVYLKGQQKKTERFQVRNGADGKPLKTPLDAPQPAAAPRGGRLRQRVVEKKKEEYEDYAEQMKTLAQRYLPPDKDAIQAAYAKGNVSMTPGAAAGEVKIVIVNYVKPGDSMTLLFDKEQKLVRSIKIASYMDGPSDAMNLSVQFDKLPDGPSHPTTATIEGVTKQLTVTTQNSDYRKI